MHERIAPVSQALRIHVIDSWEKRLPHRFLPQSLTKYRRRQSLQRRLRWQPRMRTRRVMRIVVFATIESCRDDSRIWSIMFVVTPPWNNINAFTALIVIMKWQRLVDCWMCKVVNQKMFRFVYTCITIIATLPVNRWTCSTTKCNFNGVFWWINAFPNMQK